MARVLAPEREVPPGLRAPVEARLAPGDVVWAVVAGEGESYLVATDRELLHIVRGRVVAAWLLVELDDLRPVGGARAILVRRRDGIEGSLTFPIARDRPEAIQAVTVVELLIVRASKEASRGNGGGRRPGRGGS